MSTTPEENSQAAGTRDLCGTILDGRYRLLQRLGEGGMGTVFEAEHVKLGTRVAIKILKEEFGRQSPNHRRRFLREARSAAKIQDENVIRILDFGEEDGGLVYFVMELIEGEDLGVVLKREKRLPWPRARNIALQIVSALKAAHEHHIIHRDIKPSNCILHHHRRKKLRDRVKVVDFGIAKLDPSGGIEESQVLTGTAEMFGTPAYIAPELVEGTPASIASDVYALGVVLFRMLTGRLPFEGPTSLKVLTLHITAEPPRPRAIEPSIPAPVEGIILKCLAKKPEARYGSMEEVELAIRGAQEWSSPPLSSTVVLEEKKSRDKDAKPASPRRLGTSEINTLPRRPRSPKETPVLEHRKISAQDDDPVAEPARAPEKPRNTRMHRAATATEKTTEKDTSKAAGRTELAEIPSTTHLEWESSDKPPATTSPHPPPVDPEGDSADADVAEERLSRSHIFLIAVGAGVVLLLIIWLVKTPEEDPKPGEVVAAPAPKGSGLPTNLEKLDVGSSQLVIEPGIAQQETTTEDSDEPHTGDSTVAAAEESTNQYAEGETTGESTGGFEASEETEGSVPHPKKRPSSSAGTEEKRMLSTANQAYSQGRIAEAEALYQQVLDNNPRSHTASESLGRIYFNQANYERAASLFGKAVSFSPRNRKYRIQYGDALFKLRKYDDAKVQYLKAKDLGSPKAKERIKKVDREMATPRRENLEDLRTFGP